MSRLALSLVVAQRRMLTEQICELELVACNGGELPGFEAGAHISVRTPGGHVRNYSLCNDPAERRRYVIGVKRDATGKGGSISMVDELRPGDTLLASEPLNTFALVPAERYLLIAGGIGITPMLAMLRALHRAQRHVRLIYCTRSREQTAFVDELAAFGELVTIHHDEGQAGRGYDFWPYFVCPDATHIYCCGPQPLMNHVRALTMHWPASSIHFEDFAGVAPLGDASRSFAIRIANSLQTLEVGANETALHALRRVGIAWPGSCESGVCGTCRIRVRSGDVEHRDLVLTPAERERFMMPCVSRARGEALELEL